MYYNPYYNNCWPAYPQMVPVCYPMGEAQKYYYQNPEHVTKDMKMLLKKIQELEFGATELNLYLDTHPKDKKAVEIFNTYIRELEKYKRLYRKKYGPLTAAEESCVPWQYIQGPWPWEI